MSEPEPYKVTYIRVNGVGLVANVQVPSFKALVEYKPTDEVLTIVTPSSICPEEDLKLIKEFCYCFDDSYVYDPPAGGASGSEPTVAEAYPSVGGGSGKGKKPVEGETNGGEAGDDQGRGKQPKVEG